MMSIEKDFIEQNAKEIIGLLGYSEEETQEDIEIEMLFIHKFDGRNNPIMDYEYGIKKFSTNNALLNLVFECNRTKKLALCIDDASVSLLNLMEEEHQEILDLYYEDSVTKFVIALQKCVIKYLEIKANIYIIAKPTSYLPSNLLFRGVDEETNKWVEGMPYFSHGTGEFKISTSDGWIPTYTNPDKGEETIYHTIHAKTLTQFTGLYDKNNVKIFNGDILKKQGHWDIYIVWNEEISAFGWLCVDWVVTQGKIAEISKSFLSKWEVVGSVYDNEFAGLNLVKVNEENQNVK